MKLFANSLQLSATDLANHLGCGHRTQLNRAVAEGALQKPAIEDPALQVLWQRGLAHEAAYVAHLKNQKLKVFELPEGKELKAEEGLARTWEAMQSGADVITQGRLTSGRWFGIADILRKVARPSPKLGAWSYEAIDTKLSRETKAGAVLQLCLYSELLEVAQGVTPEFLHVVSPGTQFTPDTHRVADYFAYYRLVKRRLEAAVDAPRPKSLPTYPEPVADCDVCVWRVHCDQQRRADDHLSLVANCSRTQRNELVENKVETLAALAVTPLPISWKPKRGSKEALGRTREQARIQFDGRSAKRMLHELLPVEPGRGLSLLPEPSSGDVFFDFEGDPFVTFGDGSQANGLEYLFGYAFDDAGKERYQAHWCLDFEQERATFEAFVDWLMARWKQHPGMHVFHYAPYEPTAMKRLMGRYGTREDAVDQLLRGKVFVDLFSVVRQGLRASVESYSIKRLEPLYDFEREVELDQAGTSRRKVEHALELGKKVKLDDATRGEVEGYNKDDCISAWKLRDWLEELRGAEGGIERPAPGDRGLSDDKQEGRAEHQAVRDALRAGIPADAAQQTAEQRAKLLLSHLVDFYWREAKGTWWELFRLKDLPVDDLVDERAAIAELTFDSVVQRLGKNGKPLKKSGYRYRFPPQEVQEAEDVWALDDVGELQKIGSVDALDADAGTIEVLQSDDFKNLRPRNIFLQSFISMKPLEASLFQFAQSVVGSGLTRANPQRAGVALLVKETPRLVGGSKGPLLKPGEDPVAGAARVALAMDETVLAIQGPPGTGKSYTGAEVICRLVAAGKKVGVTAVSHAVIEGLLEKTIERARALGIALRVGHKNESNDDSGQIREFADAKVALGALAQGEIQVLGGTAWLWANPVAAGAVHHLVIDEAGQLSLANALSVGPAAQNLILLGDHQQLDQPQKVTHPEGSDVSALEHLLGKATAIAPELGIFLEKTRRLHPTICALTSELFYGGKLHPLAGLERQALVDTAPIAGAGLWFLPVEHEGNKNQSLEEVDAIEGLVKSLLRKGGGWIDREGKRSALTADGIKIVAPYNVQVSALQARLPGVRVGTVDKFQGAEAPVVIISMTSSSAAEAPRGMEFLYSPKRFNVATSRAQCACVLVASPKLFEADCKTPEQMRLANAFCRYLELASVLQE